MAKTSAIILGIIFVIAGIWGFFSETVLGFMAADTVSSIIHIVVGIILLALASKPSGAMALKVLGIIYVIFGILGFVQGTSVLGIFTTNAGANWVYLILGIIMAILGWSGKKSSSGMSSPMSSPMSSTPQM